MPQGISRSLPNQNGTHAKAGNQKGQEYPFGGKRDAHDRTAAASHLPSRKLEALGQGHLHPQSF